MLENKKSVAKKLDNIIMMCNNLKNNELSVKQVKEMYAEIRTEISLFFILLFNSELKKHDIVKEAFPTAYNLLVQKKHDYSKIALWLLNMEKLITDFKEVLFYNDTDPFLDGIIELSTKSMVFDLKKKAAQNYNLGNIYGADITTKAS